MGLKMADGQESEIKNSAFFLDKLVIFAHYWTKSET